MHVSPPTKATNHIAVLTWPHFELVEPRIAAACLVGTVVVAVVGEAALAVVDVDVEAHGVAPAIVVVVGEGGAVAAVQLLALLKRESTPGQDVGMACSEGGGGGGRGEVRVLAWPRGRASVAGGGRGEVTPTQGCTDFIIAAKHKSRGMQPSAGHQHTAHLVLPALAGRGRG